MEDCDRAYRPHNEVFVRDWNTFKQVWADFSFIKSLGDPKSESCINIVHQKFYSLITDNSVQQCFVFPESLKPEYVELFKEVVCSPCFEQFLDYEFEGMYLDKPKQLVVFRKRASVESYLSKYRLNKSYGDVFAKIIEKWKDALELIIERNLKISNEESKEEIDKATLKINHFNKFSLDHILDHWRELTNKIMLDFKSQPKKEEIQFLGVNDLLTREIKTLCNSHELYFSDRYDKASSSDEYRDIVVTKTDRNHTNYFIDNILSDDDNIFEDEETRMIEENIDDKILEEKAICMVEPKGFENVTFLSFSENGAKCLVELESSGISNPIQFIQIKLLEPSIFHHEANFIQQIEVTDHQKSFQIVLPCLSLGFSHFELRTGNVKGLCINPSYLKVWFEGSLTNTDETGMMKLTNYNNYSLYVLGRNEAGLIPNESKESMESNEIITCTDEKWQKTKFQCSDFSISTHVIINNRVGDVAGWGKMFCYDCMGEEKLPKKDFDEEIDPLAQILSEKFRIEQPSLILRENHIRQVSCGEGYCLMVDCLGKAWSFGINTFGQLGLEHTNENVDTTEPVVIPFFRRFNIFVTQVTASVFGGSFAIDDKGQGYRWGTNQIEQSNKPIKDNYDNIINFEYPDIYAPQCIPIPISSKFITDRIISIQAGIKFVLALTENYKVYAWGSAKYYGRGKYEDAHFNKITNFCNPINVRDKVKKISVGEEHVLALTTDGHLLGWGKSIFFKDDPRDKFAEVAQIVAKNYEGFFTCGTDFSILEEEGKAKVIGRSKNFKNRVYELPCVPEKILASEGTIFVMGTPLHKNEKVNFNEKSPLNLANLNEAFAIDN